MALGRFWTATTVLATLAQVQDPHAHHRTAPTLGEGGWVRYQHESPRFSLEHPADWRLVSKKPAVSVHIAHPTKAVHLFVSAFSMPEGTLQDFATLKFGVQREIFKPLGPARAMEGVGWSGLMEEADATQDGERARRRILCAKHVAFYVSLALYIDPKELVAPDTDYERIFTSLRFDAGADAPSAPVQPH